MPRRQSVPRKSKYSVESNRVTDRFRAKLMRDGKRTLSDRILRQALAQLRQIDEPRTVAERPTNIGSRPDSEPGLAGPADPGQRHQPGLRHPPPYLG